MSYSRFVQVNDDGASFGICSIKVEIDPTYVPEALEALHKFGFVKEARMTSKINYHWVHESDPILDNNY